MKENNNNFNERDECENSIEKITVEIYAD